MSSEDYKLKSLVGTELLDENSPGKGIVAFSNQVNPSKRYCGVFCPVISRKSNILVHNLSQFRRTVEAQRILVFLQLHWGKLPC